MIFINLFKNILKTLSIILFIIFVMNYPRAYVDKSVIKDKERERLKKIH